MRKFIIRGFAVAVESRTQLVDKVFLTGIEREVNALGALFELARGRIGFAAATLGDGHGLFVFETGEGGFDVLLCKRARGHDEQDCCNGEPARKCGICFHLFHCFIYLLESCF